MEASLLNLNSFHQLPASFPLKCQQLEDEDNSGGSGVLGASQYSVSPSITISHHEEDLAKNVESLRDIVLCWCCYGDSNSS